MKAKIVADSRTFGGDRLTTVELEIATMLYPDLVSYRSLSVSKLAPPAFFVDWVEKHHVIAPSLDSLGRARELPPAAAEVLLAPYSYCEVLVSATEWSHFLARWPGELSRRLRELFDESKPRLLRDSEWHMPYVETENEGHPDFLPIENRDKALQICVDRCAKTQGAHDNLIRARAFSWFEHAAQALGGPARVGNFVGWKQYRKFFREEWEGRPSEPGVNSSNGWSPMYARMEEAFREMLIHECTSTDGLASARGLLEEFFPRDAERIVPKAP